MLRFIGKPYPIKKPTTLYNLFENNRTEFNEKLAEMLSKQYSEISCSDHPDSIADIEVDISKDDKPKYKVLNYCCRKFKSHLIDEGFTNS